MTGLVKWNHPQTGIPITFQDVRPGASEPWFTESAARDDTLAAIGLIKQALAETPGHEGRHAAVATLFDRRLTEARAAFPGDDGILGCVSYDHDGDPADRMTLAEEALILLAGPIGDKAGPP